MRFRAWLLLVLVGSGPLAGQGEGQIEGRVLDQAGRPVPGAQVSLEGSAASVVSDSNGGYRLESVAVGAVKLTVQARSCLPPQAVAVDVVARGSVNRDLAIDCLPENGGFMVAAYVLVGIIYLSYGVSLMLRAKQVSQAAA
jgi:hypothetical protein